MVGVLKAMVPWTESRTGAVKISPSGMFALPVQGIVGISLMENRRSVPGPVSRTLSVVSMSRFKGAMTGSSLA